MSDRSSVATTTRDDALRGLWLLTATLFVSYLCIGLALPVVPVFVTEQLHLGNAWAGGAVGVAFAATILTRGVAGSLSDRRGAKRSATRGLAFYVAGALVSWGAALPLPPMTAYGVLIAGRLLLGLGESLMAVGIIAWGIDLVGPARSGKVLAFVGAALYGAVAVGGPTGLAIYDHFGFHGTMLTSAVLPALGLLALAAMPAVPVHASPARPSLASVFNIIWRHGLVVCAQGIGFAAIGAFFALSFREQHWAHAGLGLAFFGGGFVLSRVLFGHLPDKIGGFPVAIGSLVVEAIGQACIWGAGTPTLALVGACLTGLGCSMVYPAMGREVVRIVPPHLRATALGAYAAFQDLAYGLTGPLAGLLADRAGYGSVFLTGAIASALGLSIAIALRRRSSLIAAAA